jgi:hypothetical protein
MNIYGKTKISSGLKDFKLREYSHIVQTIKRQRAE